MPACNVCHELFDDFGKLAHHIIANKRTHRKGRTWAAKYLATHSLSLKALRGNQFEGRTPLTEGQKEAKKDTVRELSGETQYVETICPKCKIKDHRKLEAEYVKDPNIWKSKNGVIFRLCEGCR